MRSILALGLLAASTAAQNVLTVGPGGFAQIGDAILAAAPGDVVHISSPATYRPFTLNKGITLRAIGTGQVSVLPDPVQIDTIVHVPVGQHARISGLTFLPGTLAGRVVATGGMLSLDACWFDVTALPSLEVHGGSVVAWNCQFLGNPAVLVQSSSFAAVHCGFNGSLAGPASAGGNGLEVVDGSVQLAWCQPRGGSAHTATGTAGHGLVVHGASMVSVSDSIVAGGNALNASLPGSGLVNHSSFAVRHTRCTFVGGTHPVLPHGVSSIGLRQAAPLPGITIDPAVFRIGGTNSVRVAAVAGTMVFLVGSLSLQGPWIVPEVAAPVWAPPGNTLTIAIGGTGATGVAVFPMAIPNNLALRDLGMWLHAVTPGAAQLEISPPAGMVVR